MVLHAAPLVRHRRSLRLWLLRLRLWRHRGDLHWQRRGLFVAAARRTTHGAFRRSPPAFRWRFDPKTPVPEPSGPSSRQPRCSARCCSPRRSRRPRDSGRPRRTSGSTSTWRSSFEMGAQGLETLGFPSNPGQKSSIFIDLWPLLKAKCNISATFRALLVVAPAGLPVGHLRHARVWPWKCPRPSAAVVGLRTAPILSKIRRFQVSLTTTRSDFLLSSTRFRRHMAIAKAESHASCSRSPSSRRSRSPRCLCTRTWALRRGSPSQSRSRTSSSPAAQAQATGLVEGPPTRPPASCRAPRGNQTWPVLARPRAWPRGGWAGQPCPTRVQQ